MTVAATPPMLAASTAASPNDREAGIAVDTQTGSYDLGDEHQPEQANRFGSREHAAVSLPSASFPPDFPPLWWVLDRRPQTADTEAALVHCQECPRTWVDTRERWRAYLTDDTPRELLFYCPTCAEREFGADS